MELKFKLQASALNSAIDIVSIVPPKAITQEGGAGYLFVVRKDDDGSGKDRCYVYSQDSYRVARADFEVTDVEGEGAFIYPSAHIESFKFAEGEIAFEVKNDDENETYQVKYDLGSGAGGTRVSFNPKLMSTCDTKLKEAEGGQQFPVAILQEAISMSKPFLAKATDGRAEEHYKTIQIFDDSSEAVAKGDGTMYASNSIQGFWFHCDAFKGHPLAVHGQHLPQLNSFLSKAEGSLTIKSGANMMFAQDAAGRVFGWVHHANKYQKYSYYARKLDKYVLGVPKMQVTNQLRYMKTELSPKRDKIKVEFDNAGSQIRFQVVDGDSKAQSMPIDTRVTSTGEADVVANANIDHFLSRFDGTKADEVELRIAVIPKSESRPKDQVMFRTIDEFWLDEEGKVVGGSGVPEGKEPEGAYRCQVTRFVPAMG